MADGPEREGQGEVERGRTGSDVGQPHVDGGQGATNARRRLAHDAMIDQTARPRQTPRTTGKGAAAAHRPVAAATAPRPAFFRVARAAARGERSTGRRACRLLLCRVRPRGSPRRRVGAAGRRAAGSGTTSGAGRLRSPPPVTLDTARACAPWRRGWREAHRTDTSGCGGWQRAAPRSPWGGATGRAHGRRRRRTRPAQCGLLSRATWGDHPFGNGSRQRAPPHTRCPTSAGRGGSPGGAVCRPAACSAASLPSRPKYPSRVCPPRSYHAAPRSLVGARAGRRGGRGGEGGQRPRSGRVRPVM